MSRIMKVRNDEELKNLREIGVVGVRYRENYSRIKTYEPYTFTVVEPITLVRDSM